MKKFVIGDIHGAYRALMQCLERSEFDYSKDKLICLGDVSDGWTETVECFEELLKIKNLIYIMGNHDQWLKDWLKKGEQPDVWLLQGGQNTKDNYLKHPKDIMKKHLEFLSNAAFYYKDGKRVFVHGGLHPTDKLEETKEQFLLWDRSLFDNRHMESYMELFSDWKEIYVGHTSVWNVSHKPIKYNNVWFMDTGGGWEGKVSMMDIDSKEIFQSEKSIELYPEVRGRY